MQAIAAIVETWLTQHRQGVIARVIGAEGLGLRPAGDLLVIDANGRTGGGLLAGSVQPEVITAARQLLTTTAPHLVIGVDVDPVDATAAGLTCGGVVQLLIQRLDVAPTALWDTLSAGRPAALVTALGTESPPIVVHPGGSTVGTLGDSGLDTIGQAEAELLLSHPGPSLPRIKLGPVELIIEAWNPVPRLVIVGAADLSIADPPSRATRLDCDHDGRLGSVDERSQRTDGRRHYRGAVILNPPTATDSPNSTGSTSPASTCSTGLRCSTSNHGRHRSTSPTFTRSPTRFGADGSTASSSTHHTPESLRANRTDPTHDGLMHHSPDAIGQRPDDEVRPWCR